MKVIEFHPDELLDRELGGTLSDDDRRRLDEHLLHCSACRLERQLRADFDSELAPVSETPSLQMFVSGALEKARPTVWKSTGNGTSVAPPPRRRKHKLVFLLAAAILLVTGIAAAKPDLAKRAWEFARDEIAAVVDPSGPSTETAPRDLSPVRRVQTVASPPAAAAEVRQGSEDAELVPEAALVATAVGPVVGPAVAPGPTIAAAPSVAPTAVDKPAAAALATAAPEPSVPVESAANLFERANAARRQGRATEAGFVYRDLHNRFPSSPEARLSLALLARLELDRGDPNAALANFRAYLRSGDAALREEAIEGSAIALQRLGRATEEAEAWQMLLRAYPASAYAAVARQRLSQLTKDVP